MSSRDYYTKLTSNVNQSVFALIVGALFSFLLLLIFSMDALILFIFEIPLAFLVATIIASECLYQYKDEVSLETTLEMIIPLFKSILISIPVVFLYSSIIIILHATVESFRLVIQTFLGTYVQAIQEPIIAIPIIFFLPNLIMATTMPLLLFIYAKIHILIWGESPLERRKKKKSLESEALEIEYREKVDSVLKQLNEDTVRMQQYLLELQSVPKEIEKINTHEKYKALNMRLDMMKSYVSSIGEVSEKELKAIYEDSEIVNKIKELEIQKNAITKEVNKYLKELKKEKGEYEKPPEEEEDYEDYEIEEVEETEQEEQLIQETEETEELPTEELTEEEKAKAKEMEELMKRVKEEEKKSEEKKEE